MKDLLRNYFWHKRDTEDNTPGENNFDLLDVLASYANPPFLEN
jgi:hypothetical protein